MHCLPVKMVKQVTRRILVTKFKTIGLDFGLGATLDKNILRKEQNKDSLTYKSGSGDSFELNKEIIFIRVSE